MATVCGRIVLPESFYNIASIVAQFGPNSDTNRRALRHAQRPPTRG